jgi:hypothetical protein
MHACQAQANGNVLARRLCHAGCLEGARRGFLHGGPGILNTVQQGGRTGLTFAQQLPVGTGQAHARTTAAAIDAYQEFDHFFKG